MGRNLLRAFASVLGTKVGVIAVSVVTTPIVVRFLGSGDYGDYALVLSLYSVLKVGTESGVLNGIRKYLAEDVADEQWVRDVFGFYVRLSLLLAGATSLALALTAHSGVSGRLLGSAFDSYLLLLAAYLFCSQFYNIARGTLMGFGLEHYSEPIRIGRRLAFGTGAIALLYYGYGVDGVLASQVLSVTAAGVVGLWFVRSRVPLRSVLARGSRTISRRALLSFNAYSVLLAFLTISLYHVDVILLGVLVGSSETGYYKGALVVAEFLWLVPTAIQYSLVQSSSELWADGRAEQVTEIAARVTRLNLATVVLMAVGLAALADAFVPLYFGSEFEPAVGPLLLLLPGVVGFALARPVFAIGQGKGEIRLLVATTGVASVLNLGLNLLLIPRFGMYGAAAATSVGYGSMIVLHAWTARRVGFDPIADLRVRPIAAAGAVAAVPIFALAALLPPIAALFVVPPIGLAVYLYLALRFEVIDPSELDRLRERAPGAVSPALRQLRELQQ